MEYKYIIKGHPVCTDSKQVSMDIEGTRHKFSSQEEFNTLGVGVLPSQHQIGDRVKLKFTLSTEGPESYLEIDAMIISVHFTVSKVKYDIEVAMAEDSTTRLYNVDSLFVVKK